MEAIENSQRKSRSITIATKPQSWSSCNRPQRRAKDTRPLILVWAVVSASRVANCKWLIKERYHRHHTNRIEVVLPLHVMLDEHHVVHRLLQLKWILFARLNVTHWFIQPRHNWWQAIVAAQSTETAAQGAHQTTETDSIRGSCRQSVSGTQRWT